jgi:hypothetical protein
VTVRDLKSKKKAGVPDIAIVLSVSSENSYGILLYILSLMFGFVVQDGKNLSIGCDNDEDTKEWGSFLYRAVIPVLFPSELVELESLFISLSNFINVQ